MAGNFPGRISVQGRHDILTRLHAVDVGFIDVNFDFQRRHIDDRTDSGAREPATSGNRGNHFSRLGILGYDNPRKGRPDDGVFELLPVYVKLTRRHVNIRPFTLQLRIQGARERSVAVEFNFACQVFLHQPSGPIEIQPRFLQQNISFLQAALRRNQLCFRELEAGPDVGVVKAGQHLVLFDQHAFLNQNFGDLAGKFG